MSARKTQCTCRKLVEEWCERCDFTISSDLGRVSDHWKPNQQPQTCAQRRYRPVRASNTFLEHFYLLPPTVYAAVVTFVACNVEAVFYLLFQNVEDIQRHCVKHSWKVFTWMRLQNFIPNIFIQRVAALRKLSYGQSTTGHHQELTSRKALYWCQWGVLGIHLTVPTCHHGDSIRTQK